MNFSVQMMRKVSFNPNLIFFEIFLWGKFWSVVVVCELLTELACRKSGAISEAYLGSFRRGVDRVCGRLVRVGVRGSMICLLSLPVIWLHFARCNMVTGARGPSAPGSSRLEYGF